MSINTEIPGDVYHGDDVTLTCFVTDAKPEQIDAFKWMNYTSDVTGENDESLVLQNLRYDVDDAAYSCAAKNLPGFGDPSNAVEIYVRCEQLFVYIYLYIKSYIVKIGRIHYGTFGISVIIMEH